MQFLTCTFGNHVGGLLRLEKQMKSGARNMQYQDGHSSMDMQQLALVLRDRTEVEMERMVVLGWIESGSRSNEPSCIWCRAPGIGGKAS